MEFLDSKYPEIIKLIGTSWQGINLYLKRKNSPLNLGKWLQWNTLENYNWNFYSELDTHESWWLEESFDMAQMSTNFCQISHCDDESNSCVESLCGFYAVADDVWRHLSGNRKSFHIITLPWIWPALSLCNLLINRLMK